MCCQGKQTSTGILITDYQRQRLERYKDQPTTKGKTL
jgi:hypothetical protein